MVGLDTSLEGAEQNRAEAAGHELFEPNLWSRSAAEENISCCFDFLRYLSGRDKIREHGLTPCRILRHRNRAEQKKKHMIKRS